MTEKLQELIKIYSIDTQFNFDNYLSNTSKDILISLLTIYINNKNSSTIREILTVTIAGYKHNTKKIGFNGYRQDVYNEPINCEAKPKNIKSDSSKKLDGGGNFTDYTWARFNKGKKSNLNMLVSGFIDGKIIFLLEFPFNSSSFLERLSSQLEKRFPNGDIKNEYLRSATFNFNHYSNSKIKIVYITNNLKNYETYLQKNLFKFLCGEKC